MSSVQQDSLQPPSSTADHQHQPSSSTGNNLHSFTPLLLPQTPSLMTPADNTNSIEANSTPESRLAAALGRAIMNIPSTSFQDAAMAGFTNPLIRTLSDADSSPNQDLPTTTPPKVPRNSSLRRTFSDTITTDHEQTQKTRKTPIRRASSDPSDSQKTRTPPQRVFSSPTGKQSPQSERLTKIEDMLREIEQRCREITHSEVEANPTPNTNSNPSQTQPQDDIEECVAVERQKNGDLKFEMRCSCGTRLEVLIKNNGYCFYRLT